MTDKELGSAASDEFAELSAGHALNALSVSDEERYQTLVARHPEWVIQEQSDAAVAARLADVTAPILPPPGIRNALLEQIAQKPQGPQTTPKVEETVQRPRRLARRLFALAACLVLLVGLGYGAVNLTQYLTRPAAVVALQEVQNAPDVQSATVDASGVTATAYWSGSLQKAVLVADKLEPLTAQQAYELWFVRDGVPISAGVFEAEAGTTTALLTGDMHAGDIIAVTVEQSGGSPTGNPTTDPLFAIPTA